jgi:hypothetical protein
MRAKLIQYRRLLALIKEVDHRLKELGLDGLHDQERELNLLTQALGLPSVIQFRRPKTEQYRRDLQLKVAAAQWGPTRERLDGDLKAAEGWGGFYFGNPYDPGQREFVTDPTLDKWRPMNGHEAREIKHYQEKGMSYGDLFETQRDNEKQRAKVILRKWSRAARLWAEKESVSTAGSVKPKPKGLNGRTPAKIPPEQRTRPMTLQEAARLMGYAQSKRAEILSKSIKDGTVLAEKLSRQSYIFSCGDFPKTVWSKVVPPG